MKKTKKFKFEHTYLKSPKGYEFWGAGFFSEEKDKVSITWKLKPKKNVEN